MDRLDSISSAMERWAAGHRVLVAATASLAWPALTLVFRLISGRDDYYGIPIAFAAVVVTSWLAGLIAGVSVAIVSVALLAVLLPAVRQLDVEAESAWHLLVFTTVAVMVAGFESSMKRLKEREAAENRFKDEFLSMVSHELRTPVTVIYAGANLLQRQGDRMAPADRAEVLLDVENESEKLRHMIEDLLALYEIDGRSPPATEPVELGPLIRAVASHDPCGADRISVRIEDDPLVRATPGYVKAVLRNLLENACKYGTQGERVDVSAATGRHEVIVSVRDRGSGLSESRLRTIFQPYYRDPSVPAGTRGVGLGLTLCQRAVRAMGGRIWARNADGGGLEVSFSLPLFNEEG
jgi:signal transduction histidine kinase